MPWKTKSSLVAFVMCLCAIPAFDQNIAPVEGVKPAVPAESAVNKKAEEKMRYESLTPNLIVSDIDRSAAFYRDVLGFEQVTTVPEKAPFVFVWMKHGDINVFLNVPQPAKTPLVKLDKAVAGTNTMYVKMHGIDELAVRVREHGVTPVIPMHKEFYGMKEFAVLDPDGYLIIFAEPTQ
jgi:catechol 2,3-dioxygenase-like lactoylglutathione lyase family enzyme